MPRYTFPYAPRPISTPSSKSANGTRRRRRRAGDRPLPTGGCAGFPGRSSATKKKRLASGRDAAAPSPLVLAADGTNEGTPSVMASASSPSAVAGLL